MATIQMVNRLQERQGFRLAERLWNAPEVMGVAWWAGERDDEPVLLIGFKDYRSAGPSACVARVDEALTSLPLGDAPNLMQTRSVAIDDPRLRTLSTHPWRATVPLDNPDLTYRLVNVWSVESGMAQALVYFLRTDEGVGVPLPPVERRAA